MTAIENFWRAFVKDHKAVEQLTTADDPVYDSLLRLLQEVAPGLYFEFAPSPGSNQLVITADGKRALFATVEAVVRAAPPIPGWTVVPLKPKLGFPVTTQWDGVAVDIAGVRFKPLPVPGTRAIDLELFAPNVDDCSRSAVHSALLRAIDHGLGERQFAELVRGTVVRPISEIGSSDKTYPLTFLDEYLSAGVGAEEKDGHNP